MKTDDTLFQRIKTRNKTLYELLKNGNWYTLEEIHKLTGYPSATASAGIRDFRKEGFGNNTVLKNYLGDGIYQYKLIINSENDILKNKFL